MLQQVEKSKNHRVLFTSDGKWSKDIEIWIGNAKCSFGLALSVRGHKTRAFKHRETIRLKIGVYGHKSQVMTKIMLSQVQAPEMGLLRRVHSVTLCAEVRSSEIRQVLNIEAFLQRIERSRQPQERLARQVPLAIRTGKSPKGRLMTMRSYYN